MAEDWAVKKERGSVFAVGFAVWLYKLLGRRLTLWLVSPGVLYFYLTGGDQRRASRDYLQRAHMLGYLRRRPDFATGFRHFMAFAGALVDRFGSWTGRIGLDDIDGLDAADFSTARASDEGGVILTAHVGAPEVLRAIATNNRRRRLTVLMHTANALKFQAVMARFAANSHVRVFEIKGLNMAVATELAERVGQGEWLIVAADRLPPGASPDAGVETDFMGGRAVFPVGPFILASALKCPVHFLACVRQGSRFRVVFRTLSRRLERPRKGRRAVMDAHVKAFADALESAVAAAPLQWFNFYRFWSDASSGSALVRPAEADAPGARAGSCAQERG